MKLEDIMLISQTERQVLHDLTYMWNVKKKNSKKQSVDFWLPKVGGGRSERRESKGTSFQL